MTGKPDLDALGILAGEQQWHRSGEGPGSLELAFPPGGEWVLVRQAGDPRELVLAFDRNEWDCFLDGARNGEFDGAAAPDA